MFARQREPTKEPPRWYRLVDARELYSAVEHVSANQPLLPSSGPSASPLLRQYVPMQAVDVPSSWMAPAAAAAFPAGSETAAAGGTAGSSPSETHPRTGIPLHLQRQRQLVTPWTSVSSAETVMRPPPPHAAGLSSPPFSHPGGQPPSPPPLSQQQPEHYRQQHEGYRRDYYPQQQQPHSQPQPAQAGGSGAHPWSAVGSSPPPVGGEGGGSSSLNLAGGIGATHGAHVSPPPPPTAAAATPAAAGAAAWQATEAAAVPLAAAPVVAAVQAEGNGGAEYSGASPRPVAIHIGSRAAGGPVAVMQGGLTPAAAVTAVVALEYGTTKIVVERLGGPVARPYPGHRDAQPPAAAAPGASQQPPPTTAPNYFSGGRGPSYHPPPSQQQQHQGLWSHHQRQGLIAPMYIYGGVPTRSSSTVAYAGPAVPPDTNSIAAIQQWLMLVPDHSKAALAKAWQMSLRRATAAAAMPVTMDGGAGPLGNNRRAWSAASSRWVSVWRPAAEGAAAAATPAIEPQWQPVVQPAGAASAARMVHASAYHQQADSNLTPELVLQYTNQLYGEDWDTRSAAEQAVAPPAARQPLGHRPPLPVIDAIPKAASSRTGGGTVAKTLGGDGSTAAITTGTRRLYEMYKQLLGAAAPPGDTPNQLLTSPACQPHGSSAVKASRGPPLANMPIMPDLLEHVAQQQAAGRVDAPPASARTMQQYVPKAAVWQAAWAAKHAVERSLVDAAQVGAPVAARGPASNEAVDIIGQQQTSSRRRMVRMPDGIMDAGGVVDGQAQALQAPSRTFRWRDRRHMESVLAPVFLVDLDSIKVAITYIHGHGGRSEVQTQTDLWGPVLVRANSNAASIQHTSAAGSGTDMSTEPSSSSLGTSNDDMDAASTATGSVSTDGEQRGPGRLQRLLRSMNPFSWWQRNDGARSQRSGHGGSGKTRRRCQSASAGGSDDDYSSSSGSSDDEQPQDSMPGDDVEDEDGISPGGIIKPNDTSPAKSATNTTTTSKKKKKKVAAKQAEVGTSHRGATPAAHRQHSSKSSKGLKQQRSKSKSAARANKKHKVEKPVGKHDTKSTTSAAGWWRLSLPFWRAGGAAKASSKGRGAKARQRATAAGTNADNSSEADANEAGSKGQDDMESAEEDGASDDQQTPAATSTSKSRAKSRKPSKKFISRLRFWRWAGGSSKSAAAGGHHAEASDTEASDEEDEQQLQPERESSSEQSASDADEADAAQDDATSQASSEASRDKKQANKSKWWKVVTLDRISKARDKVKDKFKSKGKVEGKDKGKGKHRAAGKADNKKAVDVAKDNTAAQGAAASDTDEDEAMDTGHKQAGAAKSGKAAQDGNGWLSKLRMGLGKQSSSAVKKVHGNSKQKSKSGQKSKHPAKPEVDLTTAAASSDAGSATSEPAAGGDQQQGPEGAGTASGPGNSNKPGDTSGDAAAGARRGKKGKKNKPMKPIELADANHLDSEAEEPSDGEPQGGSPAASATVKKATSKHPKPSLGNRLAKFFGQSRASPSSSAPSVTGVADSSRDTEARDHKLPEAAQGSSVERGKGVGPKVAGEKGSRSKVKSSADKQTADEAAPSAGSSPKKVTVSRKAAGALTASTTTPVMGAEDASVSDGGEVEAIGPAVSNEIEAFESVGQGESPLPSAASQKSKGKSSQGKKVRKKVGAKSPSASTSLLPPPQGPKAQLMQKLLKLSDVVNAQRAAAKGPPLTGTTKHGTTAAGEEAEAEADASSPAKAAGTTAPSLQQLGTGKEDPDASQTWEQEEVDATSEASVGAKSGALERLKNALAPNRARKAAVGSTAKSRKKSGRPGLAGGSDGGGSDGDDAAQEGSALSSPPLDPVMWGTQRAAAQEALQRTARSDTGSQASKSSKMSLRERMMASLRRPKQPTEVQEMVTFQEVQAPKGFGGSGTASPLGGTRRGTAGAAAAGGAVSTPTTPIYTGSAGTAVQQKQQLATVAAPSSPGRGSPRTLSSHLLLLGADGLTKTSRLSSTIRSDLSATNKSRQHVHGENLMMSIRDQQQQRGAAQQERPIPASAAPSGGWAVQSIGGGDAAGSSPGSPLMQSLMKSSLNKTATMVRGQGVASSAPGTAGGSREGAEDGGGGGGDGNKNRGTASSVAAMANQLAELGLPPSKW